VALSVVTPNTGRYWDFHWYRQDDNGRWSHKIGTSPARDTDASGVQITNPETANRAMYTEFCGYFCVDKNEVEISGLIIRD
jgi:hypothetical protein